MTIYYTVICFIFGLVLGSFYNVVGCRLPKKESIISPSSHCTKCNHKLTFFELIPFFSYLFLGGKCKSCKQKISLFYPIIELMTGLLFMIAYLKFGFSVNFWILITLTSILAVVVVSDYEYMIICDEVLIIGNVLLLIEIFIGNGTKAVLMSVINGVIAFVIMWLIKLLGDFLFKKESMGGGDIKLMFTFGMTLGLMNSVMTIFLASFIGLPVSLILLKTKKEHEIAFGPFLSIAALILFITQFNYISLFI